MIKLLEIFDNFLRYLINHTVVSDILYTFVEFGSEIDWLQIIKVSSVLILTLFFAGGLLLINDKLFEKAVTRRMKTHHLTITNHGNTPSIFLLRTVDLPKSLALRFRAAGYPMIWVSFTPDESAEEQNRAAEEMSPTMAADDAGTSGKQSNPLIPDLSDPLGDEKKKVQPKDAVNKVTKTITATGRKAGFWASLFSNITTLLPGFVKAKGLKQASDSLKGFQTETNQLTTSINTKVNTAGYLGDQLEQLPMGKNLKSEGKKAADEGMKMAGAKVTEGMDPGSGGVQYVGDEKNHLTSDAGRFNYDESVWQQNIGKVDSSGGSLNYAQSKVLQPGDSIKIDLEIINLSESPAAASHFYKIEVLQIPQTSLHFSAPNRYINGIVIFEKASKFGRVLVPVFMIALIILSIQIIAAYSSFIF